MKEDIIYEIGGTKRPQNSFLQRLLLFVNRIPIIGNYKIIKKTFCQVFNFPISTTFSSSFYCSSPNVFMGENVGLNDTYILAYAPVYIGKNCSFSFRNMIITSSHSFDDFSTVIASSVRIGNNVWITSNVTILPGVNIGDNTVIGAGSVVTKDIPAGVFAAGNPCKVVKKINFRK
jgi:maltose O-acetyltransferase